jgi:hypothetical protein
MTAHIRGTPIPVMNANTVKLLSVVDLLGAASGSSFGTRKDSSPTWPSLSWLLLQPVSSMKTSYFGWVSTKCVGRPASY